MSLSKESTQKHRLAADNAHSISRYSLDGHLPPHSFCGSGMGKGMYVIQGSPLYQSVQDELVADKLDGNSLVCGNSMVYSNKPKRIRIALGGLLHDGPLSSKLV